MLRTSSQSRTAEQHLSEMILSVVIYLCSAELFPLNRLLRFR